MTQVQKPEIRANAIYKITYRQTGKQCYAVPSDSQPGHFYMTCWDEASASWTCTCKAGEIAKQYGKEASCKHQRACQVSVLANKARRQRARADERQMDELKAEMANDQRPIDQRGTLNGNKPFSLLR